MDKKYLKRASSGLWLYRRKTPVLLKGKYPSNFIQKSLHTHSYHEAILKRNAINAELEMELAHIKRGDSNKSKFYQFYYPWREEYQAVDKKLPEDALYNPMQEFDPEILCEKEEDKKDKVVWDAWNAVIKGEIPEQYKQSIQEIAEEWTKWAEGKRNAKYISSMATYVKALTVYLDNDLLPHEVTSGQAQKFIDALLETGKSASTVTHYKSKLQELWRWALSREKATGENPWLNVKVEASREQSTKEHFRNFTDDELKYILGATEFNKVNTKTWEYPYTTYLLPRLLPFLGARLGELALAKTSQFITIDGRMFFEVHKGKTSNAQRIVPISPVIEPLIKQAIENAGDSEWLFPEVGNATIGAIGAVNSISSNFVKVKKGLKKVPGFRTGYHSFRGHFATALEQVGCPEQLAVKIAGHKQLSLTYNLYSKYKNKDELWTYIEKIHEADCLKVVTKYIDK